MEEARASGVPGGETKPPERNSGGAEDGLLHQSSQEEAGRVVVVVVWFGLVCWSDQVEASLSGD